LYVTPIFETFLEWEAIKTLVSESGRHFYSLLLIYPCTIHLRPLSSQLIISFYLTLK